MSVGILLLRQGKFYPQRRRGAGGLPAALNPAEPLLVCDGERIEYMSLSDFSAAINTRGTWARESVVAGMEEDGTVVTEKGA